MRLQHLIEAAQKDATSTAAQIQSLQQSLEIGKYTILFVIFGLFFGGIIRQISRVTKIPYTPMLLMTGLFIGYFNHSLGILGNSTAILGNINPHLLLLIFIPILIFQSAYNCAWHVFRKSLWNIITLAGPGVLLGSIMIGASFKLILGYSDEDMNWYQAMVLGAVLSATDPVAVVSLLKELGASVRFNTLVEGESLLNDGTAMVFLNIFLGLAVGEEKGLGETVVGFIRTSFGGPLLGFMIGFIISWWLKFVIDDSVLSINITFFAAYFCYYIAQFSVLQVSGILAVVVLGLYMSSVGKHKINPESTQDLHHVWSFIQYVCQTLIFLITGVIAATKVINQSSISIIDWIKMFAFWFLMIGTRAIMILTFYPILNRTGYGINKRQIIVLIYGGLRGSLGLCLALTVQFNEKLPQRFRDLTLFYMCGMTVLTIILNGLTCQKVVDLVEMILYPDSKKKLFFQCAHIVIDSTNKKMLNLKNEPSMIYADWRQVEDLAEIKCLGDIRQDQELNREIQTIRVELQSMNRQDLRAEIRFRFIRNLKKVFIEAYEKGQITQNSFHRLSENCEIVNDNTMSEIQYFGILSRSFQTSVASFLMKFEHWPIIGSLVAIYAPNKFAAVFQMVTTYIWAAQETIHQFQQSFPLKSHEVSQVMKEVRKDLQNAVNYLVEMEHEYPTIIRAVHTIKATNLLLNYKKHKLHEMYTQGFLDEGQFIQLRYKIDKKIIRTEYHSFELNQVDLNEMLTEYPFFSKLPSHEINKIRTRSQQKIFGKGTYLYEKGSPIKSVMFIVTGATEEQFQENQLFFMKGAGSFLNPYDFTYEDNSRASCKAITNTKIMDIPGALILEFLNKYSDFREKWFKSIFPYCLNFSHHTNTIQQFFTARFLRDFIEESEIISLNQKAVIKLQNGGYIFKGRLQRNNVYINHKHQIEDEKQIFECEDFIDKGQQIIALQNSIIMKFSLDLKIAKHHHQIVKF